MSRKILAAARDDNRFTINTARVTDYYQLHLFKFCSQWKPSLESDDAVTNSTYVLASSAMATTTEYLNSRLQEPESILSQRNILQIHVTLAVWVYTASVNSSTISVIWQSGPRNPTCNQSMIKVQTVSIILSSDKINQIKLLAQVPTSGYRKIVNWCNSYR